MGNVLPEVLQTRCHWNWTLGYSTVTPRRSPSRRFSPERDRLWTGFWMFLRSGSEFVRQGNGLAVGECGAGGGEQVELRLVGTRARSAWPRPPSLNAGTWRARRGP